MMERAKGIEKSAGNTKKQIKGENPGTTGQPRCIVMHLHSWQLKTKATTLDPASLRSDTLVG